MKPDVETQNKQTQTEVKTKPVNKASQTDALPVSATPKTGTQHKQDPRIFLLTLRYYYLMLFYIIFINI